MGGEKEQSRAPSPARPPQAPPPQYLHLLCLTQALAFGAPEAACMGGQWPAPQFACTPRSAVYSQRPEASRLLGGVAAEHPNLCAAHRSGRPGRSTTSGMCTTPRASSCPGVPRRTPGTCPPTCVRRCAGPPSSTSEWAAGVPAFQQPLTGPGTGHQPRAQSPLPAPPQPPAWGDGSLGPCFPHTGRKGHGSDGLGPQEEPVPGEGAG